MTARDGLRAAARRRLAAMGNTLRPTSELMVGTRARAATNEGDGAFNPATGNG